MKKLIVCILAVSVTLCACHKKEAQTDDKKVAKEMGEKTNVFLQGDPYASLPRIVEVTPDSEKAPDGPSVDSTAYVMELDASGNFTGNPTCRVSYSQGKVYIVENLKQGKRDSVCTSYYPNGQLWSVETYRNGHQVGEEKCYQENGYPLYIGHYDANGNCCGTWKFYKENGELDRTDKVTDKVVECRHCAKCKFLMHSASSKK